MNEHDTHNGTETDLESSFERPRRQRRQRAPRLRIPRMRTLAAAGVVLTGAIVADVFDRIDIPLIPDIDVSVLPGQEAGPADLTEGDVSKFEGSGTDAMGEAKVLVREMKQIIINKRDDENSKVIEQETMYLNNGQYTATWVARGKKTAELVDSGDVVVTLGGVEGMHITTIEDPVPNGEKSHRAFGQKLGGVFGNDTGAEIGSASARTRLTEWVKDPQQSGSYHRAVACIAIASAAEDAQLVQLSTTQVNIERYLPPRAEGTAQIEGAPTIRFQIKDPTNKDKDGMMTMDDCLTILDGMGFNPETQSTDNDSMTGLATRKFQNLKLDLAEQRG